MSLVVVAGAMLQCSHGGQITVSAGSSRLTVGGHGAVLAGQEAGLSFASASPPCTNQTTTTPPAPAPCTTVTATGGTARKLAVGGTPVLLATASGKTTSAGPPGTWQVSDPGQHILEAS
jgi:hypothetical protein